MFFFFALYSFADLYCRSRLYSYNVCTALSRHWIKYLVSKRNRIICQRTNIEYKRKRLNTRTICNWRNEKSNYFRYDCRERIALLECLILLSFTFIKRINCSEPGTVWWPIPQNSSKRNPCEKEMKKKNIKCGMCSKFAVKLIQKVYRNGIFLLAMVTHLY